MLSDNELFEHPNYLLSTYQLEIYRQLGNYMEKNHLKNKDIANKLKVSNSYVSQILNGNFNFTLKKLIELGLMINKVPYLEFIDPDEYWIREKANSLKNEIAVGEAVYAVDTKIEDDHESYFSKYPLLDTKGGALSKSYTTFNSTKTLQD